MKDTLRYILYIVLIAIAITLWNIIGDVQEKLRVREHARELSHELGERCLIKIHNKHYFSDIKCFDLIPLEKRLCPCCRKIYVYSPTDKNGNVIEHSFDGTRYIVIGPKHRNGRPTVFIMNDLRIVEFTGTPSDSNKQILFSSE